MQTDRWKSHLRAFVFAAVILLTTGISSALAGNSAQGALRPRTLMTKPLHTTLTAGDSSQFVVVKFRDDSLASLLAGSLSLQSAAESTAVEAVLAQAPIAAIEPLFKRPPEELRAERARAEANSGQELADLTTYYHIQLTAQNDPQAEELIDGLNALDSVEIAYPAPVPPPAPQSASKLQAGKMTPQVVNSTTPDFSAMQGYLDPTPGGHDNRYVWNIPGGTGENVEIVQIMYDFNPNHEDLSQGLSAYLGGWRWDVGINSGTANMGIVAADNNGYGITGQAYDATLKFYSACERPDPQSICFLNYGNAVSFATGYLSPGDVISIHTNVHVCDYQPTSLGPAEWLQDAFDAIQIATASGIHVIETAGSGNFNLDDPSCLGRFDRSVRDSGAIIVGGGYAPDSGQVDRSRVPSSSYGSRVDAQGWGSNITTLGYGDLQGGTDANLWYTSDFSAGGAAATIAGSVAQISSIDQARGFLISPSAVRQLLTYNGAPQQAAPGFPVSQNIGVRPDLFKIVYFQFGCVDPFERNEEPASATAISYGQTLQDASSCPPGDQDYYTFNGLDGETVEIFVDASPTFGPDAKVSILTSSGVPLTVQDPPGYDALFTYTLPYPGQFYILVENQLPGSSLSYDLSLNSLYSCTDSFEPNDTFAQAIPIVYGYTTQGTSICPQYDLDMYRFDAYGGDMVQIDVTALSPVPEMDMKVTLYAIDGSTELANSTGPGSNAQLTYSVPSNGTFYLKVEDQNPTTTASQNYELELQLIESCVDPNEPNDIVMQAVLLNIGETSSGAGICPAGDTDFYRFDGNSGDVVQLVADADAGSAVDLVLSLYASDGTTLLAQDADPSSQNAQLEQTLPQTGTYYVKIEDQTGQGGDGYGYQLSVLPGDLMINYRSIGNRQGALYRTGVASVQAGSTTVTFSGGASLPTNIGRGDRFLFRQPPYNQNLYYVLSRDSATQLTLQTPAVETVTSQPYYIQRAFRSIFDWEFAQQGNLVADGRREVGVIYDDAPFVQQDNSDIAIIDGSTTDVLHYMQLIVAPGHGHQGIARTGALIDGTDHTQWGLVVQDDYTRVSGLEIIGFHDISLDTAGILVQNAAGVQLDNLLIYDAPLLSLIKYGILAGSGAEVQIRNTVIYNAGRMGVATTSASANVLLENSTIFNMLGYGVQEQAGSIDVYNTIAMDNGDGDFLVTAGAQSNNLSSDASASGTGSLINRNAANQFVSIAPNAIDLHLDSGSAAINAGRTPLSGLSFDFEGDPRPQGSGWDIGADEAQ